MPMTDDPQDALILWYLDETQWVLTDGTQYVVCPEPEALYALRSTHWEMTSPEELERHLAQA